MNHYLRVFGETIAELTKCTVYGERTADGVCVRFQISLRTTPFHEARTSTFLLPLRATVYVVGQRSLRLGNAVVDSLVAVPDVASESTIHIGLPLSDIGLARLDELRFGQPLHVRFELRFAVQRPNGAMAIAEGQFEHTISRDDWELLAPALRLEAPVVFELPRPPNPALGHFQAAERARREARPSNVLVECRKALEAVGLKRPKNLPKSARTVFAPDETQAWSVDERVAVAVEALRILLHTGAHQPDRAPTLGEAVFALTATAGALKLREYLESEPEDG